MTARNGHLTLFGSPYPLSMPACPTLFLRKQRHWPVTWETQLDFLPQTALDEAGTVVYWNHTCFASIGIRARVHGDKLQRIVRFSPPANAEEVVDHEISDNGEVKFLVDCTPTHYRFAFKEAKEELEEWKWLGEVDTQVMTRNPDVGAPFTGMMFGLYSYGEMQPVLTPAHFAYAEFR